MSIRLPIGPAAALLGEGAADFTPVPAERLVRFADAPVEFVGNDDAIRIPGTGPGFDRSQPPAGRITYN